MKGAFLFSLALAPPGDGWFGRDKVKHFVMSAFTQSVAYSALQAAGAGRGEALAGASAVTLAVGVGKEVLDHRAGRPASARDLAWDLAGAGAATLVIVRTERSR